MHDNANETTIYFDSVTDAQNAAEELQDRGYHAHLSSSETGEGFWDNVKRFFGAESTEQYGSGALVNVSGDGNLGDIQTIVSRYNGRLSGSADVTARSSVYDSTTELRDKQKRPFITDEIGGENRGVETMQTVGTSRDDTGLITRDSADDDLRP